MKQSDLFNTLVEENIFGFETSTLKDLKSDLVNQIAKSPHPKWSDIEVLKVLLQVVQEDFISCGTSGPMHLTDSEVKVCLRAIRSILGRSDLGELDLPFRDFSGFGDWWRKEGMVGGGSWAIRRGYIQDQFQPLLEKIEDKEEQEFLANISDPVTELADLKTWTEIKSEVLQLRNRFAAAKTPQDFSAVGTACVRVIEGVSRVAYDHTIHSDPKDEIEPPVDKTDIRIGRVIQIGLSGRKNEQLRNLAKACSAAAHRVKHGRTPNKLQAGIACDATVLLTSIIQRIETARLEAEI